MIGISAHSLILNENCCQSYIEVKVSAFELLITTLYLQGYSTASPLKENQILLLTMYFQDLVAVCLSTRVFTVLSTKAIKKTGNSPEKMSPAYFRPKCNGKISAKKTISVCLSTRVFNILSAEAIKKTGKSPEKISPAYFRPKCNGKISAKKIISMKTISSLVHQGI